VGSNLARGMVICLFFYVILSYVGEGSPCDGLIPRPSSPAKMSVKDS
jgi:hypothetical protein